jgi:hypothetical protein
MPKDSVQPVKNDQVHQPQVIHLQWASGLSQAKKSPTTPAAGDIFVSLITNP